MVAGGLVEVVGAGEKITPGSGRVVDGLGPVVEVGGTVAVVRVVVGGAVPVVVVVVAVDEDEGGEAATVVDGADVGRKNRLVETAAGRPAVDTPVGPVRPASWDVAAAMRMTTTTPITENTAMLLRVVGLWACHQVRRRCCAPGRPKPAFFPMDRQNASRPGGGDRAAGRRFRRHPVQ